MNFQMGHVSGNPEISSTGQMDREHFKIIVIIIYFTIRVLPPQYSPHEEDVHVKTHPYMIKLEKRKRNTPMNSFILVTLLLT